MAEIKQVYKMIKAGKTLVLIFVIFTHIFVGCGVSWYQEEDKNLDTSTNKYEWDFFALDNSSEEIYVSKESRRKISGYLSEYSTKVVNPYGELMVPKNSDEKPRVTVLFGEQKNGKWKVNTIFSNHKDSVLVEKLNSRLLNFLKEDPLFKDLKIETIQIPLKFYEGDQLKVLN